VSAEKYALLCLEHLHKYGLISSSHIQLGPDTKKQPYFGGMRYPM